MEFLKEFFEALYPTYDYANLKSPLFFFNLNYFLAALYIGIVVGIALMAYRQTHLGRAVRAIITASAHSDERAQTAEELGIAKSWTLKHALKRERFGSLVHKTDDGRYFIPEERRIEAETRYGERRHTVLYVVVWAIVLIPVFLGFRALIPWILKMLDNFVGGLAG